jgi:peptide/nickel transport system substrate-binding protein
VADLKRDTSLNVSEIPGIGFSIVMMNTATEPFNDVRVRRAFSYAIDRASIRKTVYFDNGKQLDSPVPESLTWAYGGPGPYAQRDLNKAKAEMQAAGKTNVKFTFQISNASPELQQIAELVKDQIKDAGLEMEIQLLEFATVVANGGAGLFQSIGLGWTGDTDPDTMYALYRSGAGFNYPKYANATVDKLLDDARATPEQAKRGELYKQVQKILWEEQPYIVYFNSPQILVTRKTVQNYQNTYNGYWATRDLDRVWKSR